MAKLEPRASEPNADGTSAADPVQSWQAHLNQARARRAPAVPLSTREALVAPLFADDHSAEEIGTVLGLSTETVRAYLARARAKYQTAGRRASERPQLRARLIEDGWLSG
jgi:DNA-binding CsgD family transcriptional regulator